ncbi:MAG: Crp/Fnr family transcriptional regulator [Acidaminobacteraceae bacterium]
MENLIGLLKESKLFVDVEFETVEKYINSNNVIIKSYDKTNIIHLQGEQCNGIEIIVKGSIVIQNFDQEGNILTIKEFKSGDMMGENLIFSNMNFFPMTISSKEETEIVCIDKDVVLKLCQIDEEFLKNLLKSISEKAVILTNKINLIALKSVRELIISYIRAEYMLQKSRTLLMSSSKKELAEKFGIQRTSLSRELQKMRCEGIIDYNSRSISIVDYDYIFKS